MGKKFADGQRVEHTTWQNRDRTGPAAGTVRNTEGHPEGGDVHWNGTYGTDSVAFVGAENLREVR